MALERIELISKVYIVMERRKGGEWEPVLAVLTFKAADKAAQRLKKQYPSFEYQFTSVPLEQEAR